MVIGLPGVFIREGACSRMDSGPCVAKMYAIRSGDIWGIFWVVRQYEVLASISR